jgi:Ribbon-helix-helix protein, copG family
MNDTLTVRLGPELAEALREEARQTGIAQGAIVRDALEARLRRRGTLKAMSRYFGVMRGPSDLSTNRTYRRQWNKRSG